MYKTWNIHPGKGTWIVCYLWEKAEDMHYYVSGKLGIGVEAERHTEACYMHREWLFYRNGDLKTRRLGELHFVIVRTGIVAHEIQHFLSHWVAEMGWGRKLMGEYCEPMSDIAEILTKEFWNGYYKLENAKDG